MNINILSPDKHKYLQIITTIADAPERLYLYGTVPDERTVSVAIVGTRKPTTYGKEVTYQIAYELAQRGIVIISGLAYGIDAIAHQAALDAGGRTIAVMAGGLHHLYPKGHRRLAQTIIDNGGAIISEYTPDVEPRDFQFLARNRIVSGLSDGVLVTEAARRSGTLATVNHALDQGREVFAIPGNITSPMSSGCNAIIQQGATAVTSYSDILQIVAPDLVDAPSSAILGQTKQQQQIIGLIKQGVRDGDQLQQQSGLSVSEFSQTMTILEIDGAIRHLGANHWALS